MKSPIYRAWHRRCRGAASLELIILLLPLLLILIAGANFAKILHALASIDSAVRVGATTGVQLLNNITDESVPPIYFADSTNGDISFPDDADGHDVFYYIRKSAQAAASPYPVEDADVLISYWCRCPEYDQSFREGEANEGETSELVANCAVDEVIRNCESRPPEIFLQVTINSEVDPYLGGKWVFPEIQEVSRAIFMPVR